MIHRRLFKCLFLKENLGKRRANSAECARRPDTQTLFFSLSTVSPSAASGTDAYPVCPLRWRNDDHSRLVSGIHNMSGPSPFISHLNIAHSASPPDPFFNPGVPTYLPTPTSFQSLHAMHTIHHPTKLHTSRPVATPSCAPRRSLHLIRTTTPPTCLIM